ncbi:MAG TPA: NtaA/DmoA family FMN-dependent monooxygenase [Bordetella sp.]
MMAETKGKRMMRLLAYIKTGPTVAHFGGWRHPEATLNDIFEPTRYEQMAILFEQAKFDGVFFADAFGIAEVFGGTFETYVKNGGQNSWLDPMTVLPLMARVTTRLGLGATISTTFNNAFQVARALASLDMLSKGRAAWNVVTSSTDMEAKNAGLTEIYPHDERYERADEFLEACMALWHTWEPDAFVLDKESGLFADPAKVRYADYQGKWIASRGPLPTPPSPQGHPVIMQAGGSPRGRAFGARWAEMIFAPGSDKETMLAYTTDMRRRIAEEGRDPDACKFLMGITPILGETYSIAQERAEFLDSLQEKESDLAYASMGAGADLGKHKTVEEVVAARGNQGIYGSTDVSRIKAEKEGVTLAESYAKGQTAKAQIGTPAMVADILQDYFESGACDGFILRPMTMPTSYEQFCRMVVPELQKRGLFRTEYEAATLRGRL